MRLLLLVLAFALITGAAPVHAQGEGTPTEASDLQNHATPEAPAAPVPAEVALLDAPLTPAEETVRQTIQRDGLHVVHFWAPWCDNSVSELRNGWYEAIEANPDVTFTFVTIWSDGAEGRDVLDRYAIPDGVTVLTQEDHGPSADKANRRKTFLGLPVTWVPTTWVFRNNGDLAYAFNYGELEVAQLQQALDGARSTWPHE